MKATTRTALALIWLAILVGAAMFIGDRLHVSGDLRKFMPEARTPAQKLLIDELGEGPGSRLLLMSIGGADAETLAAQSKAVAATLAADKRFTLVANGDNVGLEAIPDRLRPYRYLISPTLDAYCGIPTRIIASGGPHKHAILRATARAGLATAIITDAESARWLLDEAG